VVNERRAVPSNLVGKFAYGFAIAPGQLIDGRHYG